MSTGPHDDCPSREQLSALLDGETGGPASAAACASWCDEADARRDWHAWHLIGDVLRSDELASDAGRDASFLAAVRARLVLEAPVSGATVVSMDDARAARRPVRWMLPAAMAAGLVLVVGTFAVVRPGQPAAGASSSMALAGGAVRAPASAALQPVDLREPAAAQALVVADNKMIRDARLERYLAAHKQFAGTSALGVPSAFLRSATVESTPR